MNPIIVENTFLCNTVYSFCIVRLNIVLMGNVLAPTEYVSIYYCQLQHMDKKWVFDDKFVYDVSLLIGMHPGGSKPIEHVIQNKMSVEKTLAMHTAGSREKMKMMIVGEITRCCSPNCSTCNKK